MGPLAGPVEFSVGDILLMLVMVTAALLFIPTVAGFIGVYRYRRRTPEAQRSGKEVAFVFLRWAGAAALLGIAVAYLNEFLSSRF